MDTHLVLAVVMGALGVAVLVLGVWWIATVVCRDPERDDVERHIEQRDALGRAAARSRR